MTRPPQTTCPHTATTRATFVAVLTAGTFGAFAMAAPAQQMPPGPAPGSSEIPHPGVTKEQQRPTLGPPYVSATLQPVPRKALRPGTALRAQLSLDGDFVTIRFQWLRNGQPIDRAVWNRHTIRRADRGKRIQVRVTVIASDGRTAESVSPAVRIPKGPTTKSRG